MAEEFLKRTQSSDQDRQPTMADQFSSSHPIHEKTMAEKFLERTPHPPAPKAPATTDTKRYEANDPRVHLSKADVKAAEANKQGVLGSFAKGFTHNFDEYASTINDAADWWADKITGRDTKFFETNKRYWNRQKHMNEIETEDHPIAKLGGEILLDPVNLTPAGIAAKGAKAARIAKSAAMGAPIGYATSMVKNAGSDTKPEAVKQDENEVSAGIVAALNGVIAALTKGKVTDAIKDGEHLRQVMAPHQGKSKDGKTIGGFVTGGEHRAPRRDQPGELAKAALDTLAYRPEALGMSRAKADKILDDVNHVLVGEPNPKALKEEARLRAQKSKEMREVYRGNLPEASYKDVTLTGGQAKYGAEKIERRHGNNTQRGWVNAEEKYGIPFQIDNKNKVVDYRGDTYVTNGADGATINLGVRDFGGKKEVVTLHSDRGLEGRKLPLTLKPSDKADAGWPSSRFSSRQPSVSESIAQNETPPQINPFSDPLEKIMQDPIFYHALELAKSREAASMRYGKIRNAPRDIRQVNNGNGWETQVTKEHDIPNPNADFYLSKADVKKIEAGKITPEIEEKIRNDVGVLLNHPDWSEDAHRMREEAYNIFANGGHNLAAGAGLGTLNAVSGEYDPNQDLTTQVAQKFMEGMAAGVLGTGAVKLLAKQRPEVYQRLQELINSHENGGTRLGMFAGSKATGFKDAEEAGRVHPGKYDLMPRFEIDDSKSTIKSIEPGTHRLEDVLQHDELYRNYPELKDVKVTFAEMPKGEKGYYEPGKNEIVLNSTMPKDEIRSSLLHEAQHAIQDTEGFAGGGSYDQALRKIEGRIYDLEKRSSLSPLEAMRYKDQLDELKRAKGEKAFELYQKMAGEIEAREVQARQGLTPEERNIIPPYENTGTLAQTGSPEAYNSAFMAELDGRLADHNSAGIHPDEATLDFSGSRAASMERPGRKGSKKLEHLESLVHKEFDRDWADISKGLKGDFKVLFTDTFSGAYHEARDAAQAAKQAAAKKAANIHHALKQLPEDSRVKLHEYIVGDIPPEAVPPKIRQIGDNIRATVREIGDQLVQNGIVPQEAIDAWGENYLKRIYEPHFLKDKAQQIANRLTKPVMKRRGKVMEVTRGQLERMHVSGEIDPELVGKPLKEGGIEIRKLPNGKYEVRRDWTKAEREEMGEIKDAAVTIPNTIVHMHQLLENAKLLKEIAHIDGAVLTPDIAKQFSPEELAEKGYRKLPADPRFGALFGQWVRKDVADDVTYLNDTILERYLGSDNEVVKGAGKLLNLWKKAKTVWNIPTHFNNLTSNMFLMHLAGLNPADIAKNLGSAGKMMIKAKRMNELEKKEVLNALSRGERQELSGLRNELKYYREAENAGLLNTSYLEDMGGLGNDFRERGTLGKVDEPLSKFYQAEDAVNKLAMFKFLREQGWDVKEARKAVESVMPDYSRPMAKGWRALRDAGISPFIAWTYFTFPKMVRMLASKRGAIQAATALGALYGFSKLATGIGNPYSDELPDDFKMSRIPFYRDGSQVTTWKADKVVPYMQIFHPLQTAREIAFQGPLMQLGSAAAGIKLYNGRPITNPHKPISQQAWDWTKYLANQFTPVPGQVMNAESLIESLVRDKKNRKRSSDIVPRSTLQELLKFFPGINTLTYDVDKLKKKRERQK
ncbi:DUF6782 family putative metallopeptidase [Nitratifractor salsuginis]|nr:DUF6782 family putative metallopeptidase [Nitratifractor salsuginis]